MFSDTFSVLIFVSISASILDRFWAPFWHPWAAIWRQVAPKWHPNRPSAKRLKKSIRGAHFLWSWKTTCFQYHFWSVPGHHFGRFWDPFWSIVGSLGSKIMDFRMIFFTFSFWTDVAKINQKSAKICQESARICQVSARICQEPAGQRLHLDTVFTHPPRHSIEVPDRQDPKGGGGGDWPLATFN